MTLLQSPALSLDRPRHDWMKRVNVTFIPGYMDAVLEETVNGILQHFNKLGHTVQEQPDNNTDILLTTAPYGESLNWRKSLQFIARMRYKLEQNPTVFTLVHMTQPELDKILSYFDEILVNEPPDPKDYDFPGLAAGAYLVLFEQGRRGGSILSVERLLQAQTKSVKIMLIVGEDHPEKVYHFDLVGAYPTSKFIDPDSFYDDIVLRTVTTVSTHEVTDHQVVGDIIPYETWRDLHTPESMRTAALELGKRNFFTHTVVIAELVNVPSVGDSVASQYSEGCYATWEPELDALIATITGSARPVDKDNITEDELAILSGVRPDGIGAFVRHVQGKRNDSPSSEAVEMLEMDKDLPRISLAELWGVDKAVPVVRSKLHGHRGIASYDPKFVEYVPVDAPYFHYLVSCATEAQARAVKSAFSKSEALQNPDDPRKVVFTILPGHGLVLAEKWVEQKEPLQLIWEYMDTDYIVIDSHVPQGPMQFVPDGSGKLILQEES